MGRQFVWSSSVPVLVTLYVFWLTNHNTDFVNRTDGDWLVTNDPDYVVEFGYRTQFMPHHVINGTIVNCTLNRNPSDEFTIIATITGYKSSLSATRSKEVGESAQTFFEVCAGLTTIFAVLSAYSTRVSKHHRRRKKISPRSKPGLKIAVLVPILICVRIGNALD